MTLEEIEDAKKLVDYPMDFDRNTIARYSTEKVMKGHRHTGPGVGGSDYLVRELSSDKYAALVEVQHRWSDGINPPEESNTVYGVTEERDVHQWNANDSFTEPSLIGSRYPETDQPYVTEVDAMGAGPIKDLLGEAVEPEN